MTCGSKKHIEEVLAKIHVHEDDKQIDKEVEEVNARIRRNNKKKVTA